MTHIPATLARQLADRMNDLGIPCDNDPQFQKHVVLLLKGKARLFVRRSADTITVVFKVRRAKRRKKKL